MSTGFRRDRIPVLAARQLAAAEDGPARHTVEGAWPSVWWDTPSVRGKAAQPVETLEEQHLVDLSE